MERIDVKIKVVDSSIETVIPKYAKTGDAGLDLIATSIATISSDVNYIEYGTNLAIALPEGYVGLIYPRSSLSNYDLILSNHVGVIDSGYRGEIKFRFKKTLRDGQLFNPIAKNYKVGDKIGQMIIMPYPKVFFEVVDELGETERGSGGFGSSGV